MEKDATLHADRKEKCVSLPDCCHDSSDQRDFSRRPMGHLAKEVDDNDGHEGEDQFLSLEASTETLVHVSDEDTDSDLYLTDDKQILTPQEHKTSDKDSVKEAGSSVKTLLRMESNQDSCNSWIMTGEHDLDQIEDKREKNVVDTIRRNLELSDDVSVCELKDAPPVNTCDSLNVNEIVPEKQLLNSAIIAQQRKSDFPEDGYERNTCNILDESSATPCLKKGLLLSKADSGSYLLQPPFCPSGMSAKNGLEESGFSEHQNRNPLKVSTGDDMPCLHLKESLATQQPADNQVRLRKRKDVREDQDRARLESMVLLIMKVDQFDQDIENALSTSSSPSSTPKNTRWHMPDLESGSESRADTTSENHTQINVPSNAESLVLLPSTLMANSGTRPKAMLQPYNIDDSF
ncbi:LOW QUALITY PROTEIN: rho GTPase-activating protein 7-like [Rhynchocyon petersi]